MFLLVRWFFSKQRFKSNRKPTCGEMEIYVSWKRESECDWFQTRGRQKGEEKRRRRRRGERKAVALIVGDKENKGND